MEFLGKSRDNNCQCQSNDKWVAYVKYLESDITYEEEKDYQKKKLTGFRDARQR